MKYFANCKTIEELKKEYRRLALENHPDRGGNEATMKAINLEYEVMADRLKNVHESNEETKTEHKTETPKEFIQIIDALIRMHGVEIEICGSWLWVSGNTYEHKEKISALGFKYSKNKKSWYWFADIENTGKRRGKYSMAQIRNKYGSEYVSTRPQEAIEA